MLKEKYHFSVEDAKAIADFLSPMLALVPEDRANAGGMSNTPFVDKVDGMEHIKKLEVPVGSKGEGIEGWAMEVKKR